MDKVQKNEHGAFLIGFGGSAFGKEIRDRVLADPRVEVSLMICAESDLLDTSWVPQRSNIELLSLSKLQVLNLGTHLDGHRAEFNCFDIEQKSLLLALQNIDRLERREGEINFGDRVYLVSAQVHFWKNKIEQLKPSVIVFRDIPHNYSTLSLIAVAELMGVRVRIVSDVSLEGHTILGHDLRSIEFPDGRDPLSVLAIKRERTASGKSSLYDQSKTTEASWQKMFTHLIKSFVFFVFSGRREYRVGYFIKQKGFRSFSHDSRRRHSYWQLWNSLKSILVRAYLSLMLGKTEELDSTVRYFYFPLSASFEPVTQPMSGPKEIKEVIEHVLDLIPDETMLVLKEHPMQFRPRHLVRFNRDTSFYRWLIRHPKINLVQPEADHFRLLRNSEGIVAYGSSSSFLESLILGKRVISVGTNKYLYENNGFDTVDSDQCLKSRSCFPGSVFAGTSEDAKLVAESIVRRTLIP